MVNLGVHLINPLIHGLCMDDQSLTNWDAPTKRMQKSWNPGDYG